MEENPAFDGGDGVDGEVDIEAAVKAGTITAEQGLGLMQRQMERYKEETGAALVAMEEKIEAPLHTAVHSVVARMSEAPSNFQCAPPRHAPRTTRAALPSLCAAAVRGCCAPRRLARSPC